MADRVAQIMRLINALSDSELNSVRQRLGEVRAPAAVAPADRPAEKLGKRKRCPRCASVAVKGHGAYRGRHRYICLACSKTFNDLTDTPLSGIYAPEKMRALASQMASGGVSLRKSADKLGIDLKTAFVWRHKILQGYAVAPARKLNGIAEADETFFLCSEKGDKTVCRRRKARARGGKASTSGISHEQVPVIVGCDRHGELIIGVAGRGRISLKDIEEVLGDRVDADVTLCTDSHTSFKAFAKAHRLKYQPVNISKGLRVIKGIYHIQHANSAHMRLKNWMVRFHGVSTKHLDSYMRWFSLMEETKALDDKELKFTNASVTQRRRRI